MKRAWIERLVCPRTGAHFDLDPIRVAEDEVVEAFLVSQDERAVYPLVAGVAVLPFDLLGHLHRQGNVYRRSPINDPRVGRFLLGQAGSGYIVVPFDEVVGHYRDLAAEPPEGYETTPHPDDVALTALLQVCCPRAEGQGERRGYGLVVGCGVGRPVFVLLEELAAVLGLDRSIACVRRARNIAVTVEHFFLPAPKGSGLKEIPLDLTRIERGGADFAVADPEHLPVASDALDVVLLQAGDIQGPWEDAAAAVAEAQRVLAPGGWLLWHADLDEVVHLPAQEIRAPFRAAPLPGPTAR